MALDPISSIGRSVAGPAAAGSVSGAELARGSTAAGGGFFDAIGQALEGLNAQLTDADAAMAEFASGGSADLHTVMLEMQEASLGLKVGVQVRDRLLEAYQEIMRMQL
jgi:flagellar hook-basal body complex protein FliE